MADFVSHDRRSAPRVLLALGVAGLLGALALTAWRPAHAGVAPPDHAGQSAIPGVWMTAAPLTPARHSLAAAVLSIGDAYYALGGVDQDGMALVDFQRYDLVSDTWTSLPHLPQALSQVGAAAVGERIHVIGGRDALGQPTSRHDAYVTRAQTWESLAPYPAARSGVMVASWRGQLFAAGGINADGTASAAAWRYDRAEDRWVALDSLPQATGRGGMVAANGYLFAVGGTNGSAAVANFMRYDPLYDVWHQGPALPEARVAAATVVAGDYLYVLGGGGLAGDPALPWPTAWRYDLTNYPRARWESVDTHSLYPLIAAAGVCARSKLWVVGGVDVDGQVKGLNHYLDLNGTLCVPNRTPVYLPIVRVQESQAIPQSGSWAGSTDHGDPISFTFDLASSSLPTGTLTGQFYLQDCEQGGPATAEFTVIEAVPVDLETLTFHYDGGLRQITGTFTARTTAIGVYDLQMVFVPGHRFCAGTGTWQATWQVP